MTKCPSCGYCETCGRKNEPSYPLIPVPPLTYVCFYCGRSVGTFEYHQCQGPTWSYTTGQWTLAENQADGCKE